MKSKQRILQTAVAVLLLIGLLSGTLTATARATTDVPAEWESYYNALLDSGNNIGMTPGSDETQMNFYWLTDANTFFARLYVSENEDVHPRAGGTRCFTATLRWNPQTGKKTAYATATGLQANTTYYYKAVNNAGTETAVYTFTTHNPEAYSVLLFSDTHIKSDAETGLTELHSSHYWNNALETALENNPQAAFVLNAGDMANVGAASEYFGLIAPPALRSLPMAMCIGNHDKKNYNLPYYVNNPNENNAKLETRDGGDYWMRYGDALYIMLDSTSGNVFAHYNNTRKACEANPDAKWRFVMYHHSFNANAGSLDFEGKLLKAMFDPIMTAFDIDVVFTGHTHRYTRSHGISNGKIVQEFTADSVTDPKGTLYLGTSSVNHHLLEPWASDNPEIAYQYGGTDVLYSVIRVDGDKATFETYSVDSGEKIDGFAIEKSADNTPQRSPILSLLYPLLIVGGWVYTIVDLIGELFEYIGILAAL